jgi:Tfp pilus assembly pilus retraction ATPase PilT
MNLDALLADAVRLGVSDVHLKLGRPPVVRRDGEIAAVDGAPELTDDDLDACLRAVTASAPQRYDRFQEHGDLDLAYEDEVDASIQSLTSIIEPLMMIGVGVMVGIILISMYLPMFKMLSLVK